MPAIASVHWIATLVSAVSQVVVLPFIAMPEAVRPDEYRGINRDCSRDYCSGLSSSSSDTLFGSAVIELGI